MECAGDANSKKPAVQNKQINERCEQISERAGEQVAQFLVVQNQRAMPFPQNRLPELATRTKCQPVTAFPFSRVTVALPTDTAPT